ncbi:MAG: gamma-glutamyl-gamma-aminobutyrate hydrolase family protein [Chloroflexota bacterium]
MTSGNHLPLIGIPIGRHIGSNPESAAYARLRLTYVDALVAAGGVPLFIPPMSSGAAVQRALAAVDGVLFPGGWDVAPARFGEDAHPTVIVDEVLDELELELAGAALAEDRPILGICRGQQVLNVALGGTLVQDLPSAGVAHPQSGAQRDRLAHGMWLAEDSRLAEILGADRFEVNSHHHQAVQDLGRGLRAVGWATDGVIEALESEEHRWVMCVQFHPEDLVGFHEPSRRIFAAFIEACQATRTG